MTRPITTLEFQEELGGKRHYLNGEPVHCGDIIERYDGKQWVPGRYEWNWRFDDPPSFHTQQTITDIKPDDLLRWP